MGITLYFLLAWLVPWGLGSIVVLACLKRRYGYMSFALGVGYLLGLFITVITQKLNNSYQNPLSIQHIIAVEAVLMVVIAFSFRAKRCTIEEHRLEVAPPNSAYFFSFLLAMLIILRIYLISQHIPESINHIANLNSNHQRFLFNIPAHWYLTLNDWLMIDNYSQQILKHTNPRWAYLPWLGLFAAIALMTFGGLRYLGARLLPAVFTAYMLTSLPLLNEFWGQHQWLMMLLAAFYVLSVMLLAIIISLHEKRLYLIGLLAMIALSSQQLLMLLLVLIMLIFIIWFSLGNLASILFTSVLGSTGYFLLIKQQSIVSDIPTTDYLLMIKQWILTSDYCYITTIVATISLLLLLSNKRRHDYQGMQLIIIGAILSILAGIAVLYQQSLLLTDPARLLKTISLYVMPMVTLIPVCVYHVLTFDKESLPTI